MTRRPSALVVTTYPISTAFHGGQKRSRAIVAAFERAGFRTTHLSVFNPQSYRDAAGPRDIPLGAEAVARIRREPLLEDLIIARSTVEDPIVRDALSEALRRVRPDVISFEGPFPYLGLADLIDDAKHPVSIVNSTYNVEHAMKAQIYRQSGGRTDAASLTEAVATVRELEVKLARDAVLTVAVSAQDAAEHALLGARETLLIPNGIEAVRPSRATVDRWRRRFDRRGIEHVLVFTGSGHPPNTTSFLEVVGGRLGFLPFDTRLMIVGDVGGAVDHVLQRDDPLYAATFGARATILGRVSDNALAALLEASDVVLLPIVHGGGSNLKTAEAINSGRQIIATSYAMRGYEDLADLSGIHIEDDPARFRAMMVELSRQPAPTRTTEEAERAASVLWSRRTAPLTARLRELAGA